MKILALDSSGMTASVALAEDKKLVAEYSVNHKKTHSQTLLPMLDEIARMSELNLQSVDAIAVAGGPGSFTGLRIGSATAKGIGLALSKPLISVPTLEALACNAWGIGGLIVPMLDARRQQVYTGIYRFDKDDLVTVMEQDALPVEELIGRLNRMGEPVFLLGDGADAFRRELETQLDVPYRFAPIHMRYQRAGSLAARAFAYAALGKMESAAEHRPDYLRVSRAERERAARLAQEKRQGGADAQDGPDGQDGSDGQDGPDAQGGQTRQNGADAQGVQTRQNESGAQGGQDTREPQNGRVPAGTES